MVSAGLQVIKPAVTPLARWWAASILKEENTKGLVLAPKVAAVIKSFWYHVQSTNKSHVQVFGRKLDDFCRGEKLDQLKTTKIAPWWDLK